MSPPAQPSTKNSILLIAVLLCSIVLIAIYMAMSPDPSIPSLSSSNKNNNIEEEYSDEKKKETFSNTNEENNINQKQLLAVPKPTKDEGQQLVANMLKKARQTRKPDSYLGVANNIIIPDTEDNGCDDVSPDVPMSPLEEELKRLLFMAVEVLQEKKLVGWPADGTLLGLVRNGRVATDRDIDFQMHSTYAWCGDHLHSLKAAFEKRTKIKMFKVVYTKYQGKKIGRYAMVRMPPKYGEFGTGIDFNCVYTDNPNGEHKMHVHKGTLELIPKVAFPLKFCLGYGRPIPCPQDPMAVLGMFKPRYDGCMIFPHCTGDPLRHGVNRKCLFPHYPIAKQKFVDHVKKLDECGWVSLAKHLHEEPICDEMLKVSDEEGMKCTPMKGARFPLCFLQKFDG